MYGSSLTCVTRRPRASSRAPTDALASPFPIEETTPPVTNTYFVGLRLIAASLLSITSAIAHGTVTYEAALAVRTVLLLVAHPRFRGVSGPLPRSEPRQ